MASTFSRRPSVHADATGALAKQRLALLVEAEGGEEIGKAVSRQRAPDGRRVVACFIQGTCKRQAERGDGEDVGMRVRARGGFDRPAGRFLEPAQARERQGARSQHPEEQGVERAEMARIIR